MQREDYACAEENLQATLGLEKDNVDAWTLLAHAQYLQGKIHEAAESYRHALDLDAVPRDHAVYLRYGKLLIDAGKSEELKCAKGIFLTACTSWATSSSWLGVAIACYRLKEYGEAEAALVEANIADNQNGAVWAYTCLVCLELKRQHEADHAFELALRLGQVPAVVFREIGMTYAEAKKPEKAEPALRRALGASVDDMVLRRALVSVCRDRGDVDGAVDELKFIMERVGETEKHEAIKEIVRLFKEAKRDKEAHKWQKVLK